MERGLSPVEVATITGHQDDNALYAFESRGFGGEIGVVCSERLRAGYTTADPALITAFPVDLLTPSHYVHFHWNPTSRFC